MGALSSPLIFLRCILRRPPPSTTITKLSYIKHTHPSSSISPPTFPISHSRNTRSFFCTNTITIPTSELESDTETEEIDIEKEEKAVVVAVDPRIANEHKEMMSRLKGMTIKEKKDLGSYANSLGKKLKSQSVGKSGVTDAVAIALLETLEKNELLKLKILNNCPGELDDVVSQLETATGSVVVGRIGRTIIIYRPSLTKLIAEEKKKQNMKVFLKKRAAYKASYQGRMRSRGESSTSSNRSRVYRKP